METTGSDPAVVGTLAWARATDGNLTGRERLRLLAPVLATTAQYAASRLRHLLGVSPGRVATVDLDAVRWPDSAMARAAEETCRATLSPATTNHSFRTFVYGLALAQAERATVDEEELYVTALLHDIALERPTPARCFALVGAERARQVAVDAGAPAATAERIAAGVVGHATPGCNLVEHGPLATWIAAGALLDLLGLRVDVVAPALVRDTLARWPRHGASVAVGACWRKESAAVPRGRAALIERVALFSRFMRLAPFPE